MRIQAGSPKLLSPDKLIQITNIAQCLAEKKSSVSVNYYNNYLENCSTTAWLYVSSMRPNLKPTCLPQPLFSCSDLNILQGSRTHNKYIRSWRYTMTTISNSQTEANKCITVWQDYGLWNQTTWAQILTQPYCVILGKLFDLSAPLFSLLQNR